jgi:NADH-quinone oxidoreductase subunit H
MGFALVVVLMVSGSLNLSDIVTRQGKGYFADLGLSFLSWNWLPLLPMLLVYFISGIAETNRAPFDVVEGESEIVAGHMVEYSGMTFALFFLAEYMNMLVISTLTALMFFGGWLPLWDSALTNWIPPIFWLLGKIFVVVSMFLWIRATLPRYRYDQIMRLGWKVFIPLTLVWIVVIGAWMQTPWSLWK